MTVDFKSKQQEFSAYIRDPARNPAPDDVSLTRMAMYRELFFNNIDNFLASNFPVLRKIHDDAQWLKLSEDFFANHQSKTPYFSEIAEEFLDYLQNQRGARDGDYPFLLELAHYEWVETALTIAVKAVEPNPPGADLAKQALIVSDLAWPLAYLYPVHKIAPGYLPQMPPAQPTFLIVYRDPTDEVNFLEITAMTYRLLEVIQQNPGINGNAVVMQLAEQIGQTYREQIIDAGLTMLATLYDKSIICIA